MSNQRLPIGESISFGLSGEVTLDVFGEAVRGLKELVEALTKELAPDSHISWVVAELSASSLDATLLAEAPEEEAPAVHQIVEAYHDVGQALEGGEKIPFHSAQRAAKRIVSVINGRVDSVYFETASGTSWVSGEPKALVARAADSVESFGVVVGVLQTLSSAYGLRAWVSDPITKTRVRCHLSEDQAEAFSHLWQQYVMIEGRVRRNPVTGETVSVRDIQQIRPRERASVTSYRGAIGAAPRPDAAPSAEDAIGRSRDE